jgi:multicomponent Na+:H+ antiporter subunit D
VIFYLQLLLFSGLAFFLMLGWLKRTLTITLDVDWIWRGLGPPLMRTLDVWSNQMWAALTSVVSGTTRRIADYIHRHHGIDGSLARTWPTGSMAFWTTVVLAMYLILSYV